jgi:hypothetical protein
MIPSLPTLAAALIVALCWVRPAAADDGDFTITVSGLTAGTFQIRSTRTGNGYAVSSRAASAGLAGLMRSFTITSKVTGTQTDGQLRPTRYVAQSEGARAGRAAELVFDNGTPQVISAARDPDPDAPKVDPASLSGVVDPLTGLYGVFRDTPAAQACQLDLTMFDGHRVSRVTLSGARATEDGVLCDGTYTRVAGYPPKDLAERKTFEFTALYTAQGDMLQVQQLSMNSLFGPARMTRN